jgi:Glycine cleavage system protein P (pyridoxal-binding), C-terminal domain
VIKKSSNHINQNEGTIFERSRPGKIGYHLPALDVPAEDSLIDARLLRDDDLAGLPEVSEVDVIRHFTRISTWNYAVDFGMYPLGSCTMKYNPKLNERVSRFDGFAASHPYLPDEQAQGNLELLKRLEDALAEITGLPGVSLQPAAGAQGEMTGLMVIRACLEARGNARKVVLIPDSAHGTNPASAAVCGYQVKTIKSTAEGAVDLDALRAMVNEDVAALMLTNPSTLGLFEENIRRSLQDSARRGRIGLHGRREHECSGRRDATGRYGRGCHSPESAQNLFDSATAEAAPALARLP